MPPKKPASAPLRMKAIMWYLRIEMPSVAPTVSSWRRASKARPIEERLITYMK